MGMKGYKGFRKGLICKDKQYAEDTIFEESEANICVNGMHCFLDTDEQFVSEECEECWNRPLEEE